MDVPDLELLPGQARARAALEVAVQGRGGRAVLVPRLGLPRVGELELSLRVVIPELVVVGEQEVRRRLQERPVRLVAPVLLVAAGVSLQWRGDKLRRPRPVLVDLVADQELERGLG